MQHTKGLASRRAAMRLLHGVLVLGHALDSDLDRLLAGLSPSDRALARALASGTLRHLPALDRLIDSACERPLPADARARQALRLGLAGRLLLQTPPHAIIATTLPLLEGGPRRLAHGVLSTLFRRDVALPPSELPGDWHARWADAWGEPVAAAADRLLGAVPPTDLALRNAAETPDWLSRLGGDSLFPGHIRLPGSHRVETLPGYGDGAWWVQDVAAQLPARLLGGVAGLDVLDLCAAPGGKTMQLAAAGARVVAVDRSESRLALLAANLGRTGLAAATIAADLRSWQPEGGRRFAAILLDAPCSASGTFRRHPDLLYRQRAGMEELVALQQEMLARAAGWLQPGGRLLYAVCSLERAEGEDLASPPGLVPDPFQPSELPTGLRAAGHQLRILPGFLAEQGGADGFFLARFRRPPA